MKKVYHVHESTADSLLATCEVRPASYRLELVTFFFGGVSECCDIELQPQVAPLAARFRSVSDKAGMFRRRLRIRSVRMRYQGTGLQELDLHDCVRQE